MAYSIMLQEQTINRFEVHPRQLFGKGVQI